MVYEYKTNKEFIDKTYQLLEKLKERGLWNKDTLIIGLDKGVRPLAYTLKKISDLDGRKTPDIRFFDYNSIDNEDNALEDISEEISKKINPNKLNKYKNILFLDEHLNTGKSLKNTKRIFEDYFSRFSKSEKPPHMQLAALGFYKHSKDYLSKEDFIFLDNEKVGFSYSEDTGIEDDPDKKDLIKKPVSIKDAYDRENFLKRRSKLSADIKDYLHEKHPDKIKINGLENRIVSVVFALCFLTGLFSYSGILTGNIIGFSEGANRFLGLILTLASISGFFIYRKLRR